MNQTENTAYDGVLKIVRQWPFEQRIALVQDVLETIDRRIEPPGSPRSTLSQALGLLATDQPAPTDAEIKQWLDEHRVEKYR